MEIPAEELKVFYDTQFSLALGFVSTWEGKQKRNAIDAKEKKTIYFRFSNQQPATSKKKLKDNAFKLQTGVIQNGKFLGQAGEDRLCGSGGKK